MITYMSSLKDVGVKHIPTITPEHVKALKDVGLINARWVLFLCSTQSRREEVSKLSGIPVDDLLRYVNMCDLTRVHGVGFIRAHVLYNIGVQNVNVLRCRSLDSLYMSYNKEAECIGLAPATPRDVFRWLKSSKELWPLIKY